MSVLAIMAHPDDETLGCGATLARLARTRDVHILILGDGITARIEACGESAALADLYEDAERARDTLGAASLTLEKLPDLRFDTVPMLEIVWRVEAVLRRLRPDTVYTHHAGDLNRDHRITAEAVLAATRPTGDAIVGDVYACETPSATEWAFDRLAVPFRPNVFVDATDTIEKKVEAMECYRSERRPAPHPRSAEALRALARYRGSTAGFQYAEAFELVRSVRTDE
ncbi:MAG TPA: PIG-L deacetylase family protein [Actinocrinis sp.]|uniref:PIG-L deacetylase family protein n=1 Tax=Actinocrinis sp. TaxID=1920516 RepID=UPI002D6133AF|nr:PIG-L deacetylase family protein [Actinocrinis sp.]HZU58203.1 PIG-L deacetylase family protein [Actinocrinis sp.]